jgi:hypothetical protein
LRCGANKNVPVMSILVSVVRRESRAGIQDRSSILEVSSEFKNSNTRRKL